MKKLLSLLFLLTIGFAATLDYSEYTTAPSPLEDRGYVYITFCSTESEFVSFKFTPQGFTATPSQVDLRFSGTSTVPDCEQAVLFVQADQPGQYNLLVDGTAKQWAVPVVFEKDLPLSISVSEAVVHTGYSQVAIVVEGDGQEVWMDLTGNIVGLDSFYSSKLPAVFPVTFYFSQTGFQQIPLTLNYNYGNASLTRQFNLGLRVEDSPIQISDGIELPSGGRANLSIEIISPEVLYSPTVSLESECLEGELQKYPEVLKQDTLSFKVRSTCNPGIYPLTVHVGDYVRNVSMTVTGPEGYELFFNPKVVKGESSVEVVIANKGSDEMRAVSVRLLDGDYIKIKEGTFLGDLEQGDYDSVDLEFVPTSNPVQVNLAIFYNQEGQRWNITKQLTYSYAKAGVSMWTILILAGVAFFGYRKFRNRKASD
jgi:hypothetical protein